MMNDHQSHKTWAKFVHTRRLKGKPVCLEHRKKEGSKRGGWRTNGAVKTGAGFGTRASGDQDQSCLTRKIGMSQGNEDD